MSKLLLTCCLTLTFWAVAATAREFCTHICDGADPSEISSPLYEVTSATIRGRRVRLRISDIDNVAVGTIENALAGDEVWLDRSFDAGVSWSDGSKLGDAFVPAGQTSVTTNLYNVDEPSVISGMGALRACGRAAAEDVLICTPWGRSLVNSRTPIQAAVTGLMQFYKADGLWQTVGWWNAANCVTAMLEYWHHTRDMTYIPMLEDTYAKNLDGWDGNYTSDALDDTAWWALAWIRAFDLTGNRTYLDMAVLDANYIVQYRDDVCGDGIWWNIYVPNYKNAITNELYIKIAAQLHNRIPGDTKFLAEATELWDWFVHSGMINQDFLINDGLHECQNNKDTTWTYNQGVILGAAVELYLGTGNSSFLDMANNIATAVLNSPNMSPNGILREPCEDRQESCNGDQTSFKGIFLRNLGELNRLYTSRPYQMYLDQNLATNYQYNRNGMQQYGLHFIGPFDLAEANRQHTAVDAFVAAL